jgi:HEAT repeat protein
MRLAAVAALAAGMALAQMPLDQALTEAAKWKPGTSRAGLRAVADAIQQAKTPAEKQALEKRLLAFVQSDATQAAKEVVCRQMGPIASEAAVPVLAPMLLNAATSDMARYALEPIPGAAADKALREAVVKTTGKTRVGIVNSIGVRRDAGAVGALKRLASDLDEATASAARDALAAIGDPAALQALGAVRGASEWLLKAADLLVQRGNKTAALPVYRKLFTAPEAPLVRAGALHGLIVTDPQSGAVLNEALRGSDPRLQGMAIRALAARWPKQLVAEWQKLPETGRVRALESLAEARDTSAIPVFKAALADSSAAVRNAALDGIGMTGDASAVMPVAALAAKEGAAARAALARIPGKDVDAKIVAELATAETPARVELIRAAGARGTAAASPLLLKFAGDANEEVRREAVRALRDTASSGEVAGLAALIVTPVNPADRGELGRSLAATVRRGGPERSEAVVKAYGTTRDTAARATLLQTLGTAGHATALPALRAALKAGEEQEVARAAILALSDWPDATPVGDLLAAARSAASPAHQVLALRGAIKLIGLPTDKRPAQESVTLLKEAASLAKQVEEKRGILALAPRYPTQESLDLARSYLDDPQVAAEAKAAAGRLERSVRR